MPTSGSPMVRRRRLAAELRRLRASTGKTAEDVGKALGWSKAKISRYELAQSGLKPGDVARLLEFYGVQGGQREQRIARGADHDAAEEAAGNRVRDQRLRHSGRRGRRSSRRPSHRR